MHENIGAHYTTRIRGGHVQRQRDHRRDTNGRRQIHVTSIHVGVSGSETHKQRQ